MAVTLKDIAAATGLSMPTVSQILNHRSGNYCSEAKCELVFKVARELGYRQRFADKIQRGDVTHTAAIICPLQRSNNVTTALTMKLLDRFEQMGFSCYVTSVDQSFESCYRKVGSMLERGTERLILLGVLRTTDPDAAVQAEKIARLITSHHRTYVGYGRPLLRDVSQDFAPAVRETVKYFLEAGADNFKMITPLWTTSPRIQGLIASFPELSPDEVISKYVSPLNMKENYGQNEDTIMQHGYLRTAELLKQFPDTRGIYYSSDELLLGGLRYLQEQHIVPGKDILLAGFNNIPAVRNSGLPISSAAHDIDLLCDTLIAESGKTEPVQIMIPPKIFIRKP